MTVQEPAHQAHHRPCPGRQHQSCVVFERMSIAVSGCARVRCICLRWMRNCNSGNHKAVDLRQRLTRQGFQGDNSLWLASSLSLSNVRVTLRVSCEPARHLIPEGSNAVADSPAGAEEALSGPVGLIRQAGMSCALTEATVDGHCCAL